MTWERPIEGVNPPHVTRTRVIDALVEATARSQTDRANSISCGSRNRIGFTGEVSPIAPIVACQIDHPSLFGRRPTVVTSRTQLESAAHSIGSTEHCVRVQVQGDIECSLDPPNKKAKGAIVGVPSC